LWEAFLLQMNDFDRYLEHELKHLLDPVVTRRPPVRRGLLDRVDRPAPPPLVVEGLAAEAIPVVETAVTFPVASVRSL
jgi:hypothetical protein